MSRQKSVLHLMIKDNGSGFDFYSEKNNLGIEILKDLIDQLDGKLTFNAQTGSCFSIEVAL